MFNLIEPACMQNSTADEREPESSDKPEATLHALQACRVPAGHVVQPCQGTAAARDLLGLKPLPQIPARIVWTRSCNSGCLSLGMNMTGLEGCEAEFFKTPVMLVSFLKRAHGDSHLVDVAEDAAMDDTLLQRNLPQFGAKALGKLRSVAAETAKLRHYVANLAASKPGIRRPAGRRRQFVPATVIG
jgi:hypothetical protein